MVQRYTLPIPPSVNKIWRTNFKTGTVYKIEEASSYVGSVKNVVPKDPTGSAVELYLRFYFKTKARDIDSGLKTLLDSLQGYLYINDSQVLKLTVEKLKDAKNPRVELDFSLLN